MPEKKVYWIRNVTGEVKGDSLDYNPELAEHEIEAAKVDPHADVTHPSAVTTVIKYRDHDEKVTSTVIYTKYTKLDGS